MDFLNYTEELNRLAIGLQNSEEIILEEDIIKAMFYLNNMDIKDTGDCLIFLACLNLCNAYVKQDGCKISYSFKKGIGYIINILNNNNISDVYVGIVNNNGKLYLFQIGNIQFSFHDEKIVYIDSGYLKELSWDGVRKQKCAKALFDSVINNKIRVSNITYTGDDIDYRLEEFLDDYRDKKVDVDKLKIFHL